MSFWDIFYQLCIEKNTKPNRVAKELSIASGTITQWKNGSIPSKEKLILLSDYFGVTTDYLLGNSPVRHGGMEIQSVNDDRYIPVPVIGVVAAGYQALADTDVIGYELVSADLLNDGFEYAWLKVKGDSMYPLIMEGDLETVISWGFIIFGAD